MTMYLAGNHGGRASKHPLPDEYLQLIEFVDTTKALEFHVVRESHDLGVDMHGIHVSQMSGFSQILIKLTNGDTFWPYSVVSPNPDLTSDPYYVRSHVDRYMTYPGTILRSLLERMSGSDYSLALYLSAEGERVYQRQFQKMKRRGRVPEHLAKPDVAVATAKVGFLRMWKHPDYFDGFDMRRLFDAVVKSLTDKDYLLVYRDSKGLPEYYGTYAGELKIVLETEFGLAA
jgi:hypothetical protein